MTGDEALSIMEDQNYRPDHIIIYSGHEEDENFQRLEYDEYIKKGIDRLRATVTDIDSKPA